MKTTTKIGLFLVALLFSTGLHAQEGIHASGGNAVGTEGSISFSVGQTFFAISEGTSGSVVTGVQQPYEISTVSVNEQGEEINLTVHPNPTSGRLHLTFPSVEQFSNAHYQLFDKTGKLLMSGRISGTETYLNLGNMPSATYFITTSDGNKELKAFKIIKE